MGVLCTLKTAFVGRHSAERYFSYILELAIMASLILCTLHTGDGPEEEMDLDGPPRVRPDCSISSGSTEPDRSLTGSSIGGGIDSLGEISSPGGRSSFGERGSIGGRSESGQSLAAVGDTTGTYSSS